MSKISEKKIEKIKTDILAYLYENNLRPKYTVEISEELARDDEFVLRLLKNLQGLGLVKQANKGKRRKWVMTNKAYRAYKEII